MHVKSAVPAAAAPFLSPREFSSSTKREGRLLPSLVKPLRAKVESYPSPPMSDPPSPSQSYQRRTSWQSAPLVSAAQSTGATWSTASPALSLESAAPRSSQTNFGSAVPYPRTSQQPVTQQTGESSATPAIAGESTALRPGRKAKAHVASACVNCKRAHLSCDVQRPCARCVASGKQDTCFDVAHKKRGRPRLREESEPKTGTVMTPAAPQPVGMYTTTEAGQASARPIARARHRRAESFVSFQSHGGDETQNWSVSGSVYGTPHGYPAPAVRHEVPTAFLDLDLVVIKANQPFEQIMLAGQDLRGRHLFDFAAPADTESFNTIRNKLRAEREARDPVYMPPIVERGQDLIPEVTEAIADMATRGYSDQTYSWTQTRLGAAAQTFPARVRLARGTMYFVVVTLPSFRPVEPTRTIAPSPFAIQPASSHSNPDPRRQRETPRSHFPPQTGPLPPAIVDPRADRRLSFPTFPTAVPHTTIRPTSMLMERPPDVSPFFPQPPGIEQQSSRPPEGVQLPWITSRLPTTQPPTTEATTAPEAPAKRRRLGIDDVLQR